MYRAVTLKILREKIPVDDIERVTELARETELRFEWDDNRTVIYMNGEDVSEKVRTPEIDQNIRELQTKPTEYAEIQQECTQLEDRIDRKRKMLEWFEQLGRQRKALEDAVEIREECKSRIQQLEEQLSRISVDQIVIGHAEAIKELMGEKGRLITELTGEVHGGALTPEQTRARFIARATEIDMAIIAESARWGDYRRDMHVWAEPAYLYTRNDFWIPERDRIIDDYLPFRTNIVLNQYRGMNFYPAEIIENSGDPDKGKKAPIPGAIKNITGNKQQSVLPSMGKYCI